MARKARRGTHFVAIVTHACSGHVAVALPSDTIFTAATTGPCTQQQRGSPPSPSGSSSSLSIVGPTGHLSLIRAHAGLRELNTLLTSAATTEVGKRVTTDNHEHRRRVSCPCRHNSTVVLIWALPVDIRASMAKHAPVSLSYRAVPSRRGPTPSTLMHANTSLSHRLT